MDTRESETISEIRRLAREHGIGARRLSAGSGVSLTVCGDVLGGRADTTTVRAEAMLTYLRGLEVRGGAS